MRDGRSGIRHVTGFDCSDLPSRVAGQIVDFDPTEHMTYAEARRSGALHYALAAAHMAVEDAEVDLSKLDRFRAGAIFGSSVAANGNIADHIYERWQQGGAASSGSTDCVQLAAHAATAHVFISMACRGRT